METRAHVVVNRRAAERVRAGHPWIYKSDVVSATAGPGDLVRVVSEHKRSVGWGWWSSESLIGVRILQGSEGSKGSGFDERALIERRLDEAITYRASLGIDGTAYRLVHSEADRLPGLVVDCYGDGRDMWLVLQTLCQATDRRLQLITDVLVERLHPRGVLARNDPKVRRLEGLEMRVDVVFGDVPDVVEVREGATTLQADLRHGQKTGLFLDQRENHAAAAGYARGRALDAFSYHGGFALAMARRADSVLALDSSAPAVAALRDNAVRNSLTNIESREVNVFDELRELEVSRERFDTVVLDPPAFAKNRASVDRAAAGYKEINLRAMKMLAPGGHLITCSCSHHIDEPLFLAILEAAAADAHVPMVLVERRQQARDHPVLLGVPETSYLKCFVLKRVG
jgi:23S rRNA (cytosine1962-C5)-methyltransferase